MSDVKAWREGSEPANLKFPDDFEVLKKATLQLCDIVKNCNKYYNIELHSTKGRYRVYTHYGRTDDLASNPNAGAKELRFLPDLGSAQACYDKIYREKTSAKKGYKELSLASSNIGSHKTRGQSSGTIDEKTLSKLDEGKKKAPAVIVPSIPEPIQDLVGYLYGEATNALTTQVNATITAKGIETPLGVLTIGQIDKGQAVIDQLVKVYEKNGKRDALTELSGEFYTLIPHRFGRSREAAQEAVLDSAEKLNSKQETLQLMRDMLNVNGKTNVLVDTQIENKYKALNCTIECVSPGVLKEMREFIEGSQVRKYGGTYKVKNIWKICRPDEHKVFAKDIGNHKQLMHGSSPKNWVGIMSRGLLLPKIVVSLGVHRTDAGWLGNGIYFGNAICTSCGYAGIGKRRTRFVAVASVALGKVKQYSKITYGLNSPPDGYDSCHGVRGTGFADDEFVIYKHNQQKLEYLAEIS